LQIHQSSSSAASSDEIRIDWVLVNISIHQQMYVYNITQYERVIEPNDPNWPLEIRIRSTQTVDGISQTIDAFVDLAYDGNRKLMDIAMFVIHLSGLTSFTEARADLSPGSFQRSNCVDNLCSKVFPLESQEEFSARLSKTRMLGFILGKEVYGIFVLVWLASKNILFSSNIIPISGDAFFGLLVFFFALLTKRGYFEKVKKLELHDITPFILLLWANASIMESASSISTVYQGTIQYPRLLGIGIPFTSVFKVSISALNVPGHLNLLFSQLKSLLCKDKKNAHSSNHASEVQPTDPKPMETNL
jgi:hypothetical protein